MLLVDEKRENETIMKMKDETKEKTKDEGNQEIFEGSAACWEQSFQLDCLRKKVAFVQDVKMLVQDDAKMS